MKKLLALCLSALVLVGCSSNTETTTTETSAPATTEATVETTAPATTEAAEETTAVEQEETAGLGDTALETVTAAILENQSVDVDTVSGATVSSEAAIAAVQDCIDQATAQ